MWISALSAADLLPTGAEAASETGRRALVYLEAVPALCWDKRRSILVVIPQ